MRRPILLAAITFLLAATGCATCRETLSYGVVDSVLDTLFGSSTDSRDDLNEHVLKRKGIEPGSDRHKRLVAEEKFYEEFRRDANSK